MNSGSQRRHRAVPARSRQECEKRENRFDFTVAGTIRLKSPIQRNQQRFV
jgi:hypothetical protein